MKTAISGLFAGSMVAWCTYASSHASEGSGVPCLIFQKFGILCPGCGMTRATACLMRGDVMGAVHFNAMLPVFVLAAIMCFLAPWLPIYRLSGRAVATVSIGYVALMTIFTVVRNI